MKRPARALARVGLALGALGLGGLGCGRQDPARTLLSKLVKRYQPKQRGSKTIFTAEINRGVCSSSWHDERWDEELELLRIGKPAIAPILETVRNEETPHRLRPRLLGLLGQIGDDSVADALLRMIDTEREIYMREACFHALGCLKSARCLDRLRGYMDTRRVPARIVLWAMGMSGSRAAAEEYMDIVEDILASEELENLFTGLGLPGFNPESEFAHYSLAAKVTDLNRDLRDDIWRVAQLTDLRVVRILINALGYHDPYVQHVAAHFLERQVEGGERIGSCHDSDIHVLKLYERWMEWYKQNGDSLRWDEEKRKYALAK